jgi:hypothetical protein
MERQNHGETESSYEFEPTAVLRYVDDGVWVCAPQRQIPKPKLQAPKKLQTPFGELDFGTWEQRGVRAKSRTTSGGTGQPDTAVSRLNGSIATG